MNTQKAKSIQKLFSDYVKKPTEEKLEVMKSHPDYHQTTILSFLRTFKDYEIGEDTSDATYALLEEVFRLEKNFTTIITNVFQSNIRKMLWEEVFFDTHADCFGYLPEFWAALQAAPLAEQLKAYEHALCQANRVGNSDKDQGFFLRQFAIRDLLPEMVFPQNSDAQRLRRIIYCAWMDYDDAKEEELQITYEDTDWIALQLPKLLS